MDLLPAVRCANFCSGDFEEYTDILSEKHGKTLPFTGGFAGGGTVFT
jgi:hypothetical protein